MHGEREKLFNALGRWSADRMAFAGADRAYFIQQIAQNLQALQTSTEASIRGMALQGLHALLSAEAATRGKSGPDFSVDITQAAVVALKRLKAAEKRASAKVVARRVP